MTSLRLHLKVVSLNHYKVNSVSVESIRTPGVVLGGILNLFAFLALYFVKFDTIYLYIFSAVA